MEIEPLQEPKGKKMNYAIIIAILIGAWIIGMSIIAAGWLITGELKKDNQNIGNSNTVVDTGPINIDIPAGIPVLGDNNAPVTIVEFADFQCPFCGEWHKTVLPELKSKYINSGKVRFVYMDYAFLGEESFRASEAARCANDQNKFWEYHDKLYSNQKGENEGAFSDSNLKQFSKDLGLNEGEFNSCLDGKKHQPEVMKALETGNSYGVQSTPTIFINGYKFEGVLPFESYVAKIESELAN